jgi:hypothetical protein
LDCILGVVDSKPQHNKYCLMLLQMGQDAVKEQYKRGTETKIRIILYFKNKLNNKFESYVTTDGIKHPSGA